MKLNFDAENNIVYIAMSGSLDKESILTALDSAVTDKRYRKGMGRIWDFRDADMSSLESADILAMGQYSLKFPPGVRDVKVAFVTDKDLEFGMSRMFQLTSNAKTPVSVFRSMEAAEGWMCGDDK